MNAKYVVIMDAQGATLGYGGPYHPITHRIGADKAGVFGLDNLVKLFPSDKEAIEFIKLAFSSPTGTQGRFSWQHE